MKTISFSMLVLIASPSLLFGQDFNRGDFDAGERVSKTKSSYFAEPSSIDAPANHLKHSFLENKISSDELSDEFTAPRVAPVFEPSTRISMQGLKPKADLLDLNQPTEPQRFLGPSTRVRFSQLAPTPLAPKALPAKVAASAIAKAEVSLVETAPQKVATSVMTASERPVEKLPKAIHLKAVHQNELPSTKIAVTDPFISGGEFQGRKATDRVSVGPYMASDPSTFKLKMAASMQPLEPASEMSWQDIEVVAPPAAQEIINEIDRPMPESGTDFQSTEIVNESPSNPEAIEPSRDETFAIPSLPEPAPVDRLDVFQRVQPWEKQASTMRHVTDHFSPGGEPFAQRTHQLGNPNVFGVDRRDSCDEWNGFGNCGGLKQNPGHLGLPWLGSKEACDQTIPLRCGCRSCKSNGACQCEQCDSCNR